MSYFSDVLIVLSAQGLQMQISFKLILVQYF